MAVGLPSTPRKQDCPHAGTLQSCDLNEMNAPPLFHGIQSYRPPFLAAQGIETELLGKRESIR
jgi:hypothetical protein